LCKTIGISTGRASELMQISDGRKTVADVRAGKAESMKRLRAKTSSPRGEEGNGAEPSVEVTTAKLALVDNTDTAETSAEPDEVTAFTVGLTKKRALAAGFNVRAANRLERFGDKLFRIKVFCEEAEQYTLPAELNREQARWAVEEIKIAEAHLKALRRKITNSLA
jgi:hypothetical protein